MRSIAPTPAPWADPAQQQRCSHRSPEPWLGADCSKILPMGERGRARHGSGGRQGLAPGCLARGGDVGASPWAVGGSWGAQPGWLGAPSRPTRSSLCPNTQHGEGLVPPGTSNKDGGELEGGTALPPSSAAHQNVPPARWRMVLGALRGGTGSPGAHPGSRAHGLGAFCAALKRQEEVVFFFFLL